MNNNTAFRLLIAASVLMLLAGCLCGFMHQWLYAGLVLAGAFGCAAAAVCFRNGKNQNGNE